MPETAKNRKLKPCVLYTPVAGSFTHNGTAGPDDLLLPATVGTTKLVSGSYRLTATPTANGQTAAPAKREFSVKVKGS